MATKNIVPRADGEGSIGTSTKKWGDGQFDDLHMDAAYTPSADAQVATKKYVDDASGGAPAAHASTHKGGGSDAIDAATTLLAGLMAAADKSKLDGIESGATGDLSGAEIKALYEAEADTNALTDALLSKLNGIEAGATGDQTGAEIKVLYEAELDTNAFTDALLSKLNAIEAGADVTGDHNADIDHTAIQNIGSNSHSQIDTHLDLVNAHIDWTGASANFLTSGTLGCGAATVASITNAGWTATRLLATNASKAAESTSLASWLTGTANRVTVTDDGDGTVTLTAPQDLHTGASPTFDDLIISTPSNIYALSHDLFADFVANEHIDWTNATANFLTTGTLGAGVATLATGSTIGNLTLANGSITDSGGTIDFGDEILLTTGFVGLNQASPSAGLHVGSGSDEYSFGADDIICSKLQIKGYSYFDERVNCLAPAGNIGLVFYGGQTSRPYLYISTEPDDGAHFCVAAADGDANHHLIICSSTYWNKDYDHATASTNPTLFIHSAENPDTNNTQWVSFAHDQTDGVITVGTGTIKLASAVTCSSTVALNDHATLANTKDLLFATDGGSDVGSAASRAGTVFTDNLEMAGVTISSLATTVGDPGADTTLVTEQGIREALDAAVTGVCFVEVGTYTGDGAVDQQINLTDTSMVVLKAQCYRQNAVAGQSTQMYERVSGFTANISEAHIAAAAANQHYTYTDRVSDLGTGHFHVDDGGSNSHPNANGITYVYIVWGTH